MVSEELGRFIRLYVRGIWALEVLLLMCRDQARPWTADELNRELRGTAEIMLDTLGKFERAGLVQRDAGGGCRWAPTNEEAQRLSLELVHTYSTYPFSILRAITDAQTESIQTLADAFKIKKT